MADDPRVDAAATRLMMTHPSWFKRLSTVRNRKPSDAGHGDAQYAARTVAEAALRGADSLDPLRVLLADEAKLVDIAAEALYYVRPILHGDGSWAWVSEASKNHYQEMVRPSVLAVLAALRKEAGL